MLENTEMRFADAEAMGLSHDEWLLIPVSYTHLTLPTKA